MPSIMIIVRGEQSFIWVTDLPAEILSAQDRNIFRHVRGIGYATTFTPKGFPRVQIEQGACCP